MQDFCYPGDFFVPSVENITKIGKPVCQSAPESSVPLVGPTGVQRMGFWGENWVEIVDQPSPAGLTDFRELALTPVRAAGIDSSDENLAWVKGELTRQLGRKPALNLTLSFADQSGVDFRVVTGYSSRKERAVLAAAGSSLDLVDPTKSIPLYESCLFETDQRASAVSVLVSVGLTDSEEDLQWLKSKLEGLPAVLSPASKVWVCVGYNW